MSELRTWWQGADMPFHCRPDDPWYSTATPEAGESFTLRTQPGMCAPVQLMLCCDEAAQVTALESACEWPVHAPAVRGVDRFGKPMARTLEIAAGKPWPIWVVLEVPMQAQGSYPISFTIVFSDGQRVEVNLCVEVAGEPVYHGGEDDMATLARLKWLDSTLGTEPTVTAPYQPIAREGQLCSVLGRDILLGEGGLPEALCTHFMGANETLRETGEDIFAAPPRLEAVRDGMPIAMKAALCVTSQTNARVTWEAKLVGGGLTCQVAGFLEFDGWMRYTIHWEAKDAMELGDIRLLFFPKRKYARYFTGVGTNVREHLAHHHWKWERDKHQDGFFVGGINGGIVVRPLAEDYIVPYCNIYYKFGYRNLPRAWVNEGRGYFELTQKEGFTELGYHTGALKMSAGETLHTDFEMGFTPFKLVNQAAHYGVRYYQAPGNTSPQGWLDTAEEIGATHVNVHHAKDIYPYINYPMFDAPAMQDFAKEAHQRGLKMKPYYTVRELTSKLPEFFPLRSLGDEIYAVPNFNYDGVPGQGEKDAWLKEECGNHVLPAWKAEFTQGKYKGQTDPSVVVNPASRIVNFYIEGLRWMCDNWDIDGIYVDDTGLDRYAFQRARRVLDGRRPGAKIDLHSWSHFHDEYGESWGHNAVMYAEIFPYLDSLWFGEGFDFNEITPNEMLVECSGLPFGLMSEMLQGGGNPWRGLLFGMTNRAGWSNKGTEGVWAMRAVYGFDQAVLHGWWEEAPLARADHPEVYVSAYELPGGVMVCAANFAEQEVAVRLTLDAAQVQQPTCALLPYIKHVQEEAVAAVDQAHVLQPGGGVVVFYPKG